jgi:hypothetical protein
MKACRDSAKTRQQIDRGGAAISGPRDGGAPAAIGSERWLGGEPFGEQLLVARGLGERVDPASLVAAAQPYQLARQAAA